MRVGDVRTPSIFIASRFFWTHRPSILTGASLEPAIIAILEGIGAIPKQTTGVTSEAFNFYPVIDLTGYRYREATEPRTGRVVFNMVNLRVTVDELKIAACSTLGW